jgi:hypothetical protein
MDVYCRFNSVACMSLTNYRKFDRIYVVIVPDVSL